MTRPIDPRIQTAARVAVVPISELRQWDRNPHEGDDEEVQASVRRFGQVVPIVRAPDGWIISGNTTMRAMAAEGFTECAVVTLDAAETEQVAWGLASNRIGTRGEDDSRRVLELLTELDVLSGTGWEDDDVADLRALLAEQDDVPPPDTSGGYDQGMRPEPSMPEYRDRFVENTIRAMILNFDARTFTWLSEQLMSARSSFGVDTNSELFVALVAEHNGVPRPEAQDAAAD